MQDANSPDVPSLLLRRRYCAECRITFDVVALWDSKGLNLGAVRLVPFSSGCGRHRDK